MISKDAVGEGHSRWTACAKAEASYGRTSVGSKVESHSGSLLYRLSYLVLSEGGRDKQGCCGFGTVAGLPMSR